MRMKKMNRGWPFSDENEMQEIKAVLESHTWWRGTGNKVKEFERCFANYHNVNYALGVSNGTHALEIALEVLGVMPGDEVIVPSYTFVSTALAFVRQGAKIVFADSCPDNPNIDATRIEELITSNTKAIVPVHYAGVACDMDPIMDLARKYNLLVIEDAAQAIDSYYKGKPLGSIGHLAAFSFHETKNIISGEGGMLAINDERFIRRAEIIWEKGTNRAEFFRGEANKYGWVDTGSSFLPSEVIAAFLWAQLENLENIQLRRKELWNRYNDAFSAAALPNITLPNIPDYATNNAHMYYLICQSLEQRTELIKKLKENGVLAVFHYLSLHSSEYYHNKHDGRVLANTDHFADCLIRLPMFYELTDAEVDEIVRIVCS